MIEGVYHISLSYDSELVQDTSLGALYYEYYRPYQHYAMPGDL